jgi:putative pyruvate formate lyase activating enzyme
MFTLCDCNPLPQPQTHAASLPAAFAGCTRLVALGYNEGMTVFAKPSVPDPRFVIDPFQPAYMTKGQGEVRKKVRAGLKELEDCCVCPRDCHVNRLEDETGICNTGRYALVSNAFAHFGEEDCLRGWNGSGTIFFGLCNLRCVFCQNWDISQQPRGRRLNPVEMAALILELQKQGCHNINFVTPEHVVPQVMEGIAEAIERGLKLPIVYNTSAYDSVASLKLMEGIVDIYMPDFKFWHRQTAKRLARAPDYPEVAREAIAEMHRQTGVLRFGPDGLARRGLLVRHLVMPGQLEEAAEIFRWLAEQLSPDTYVNIMGQYRPEYQVGEIARGGEPKYADINRRPSATEISHVFRAATRAGLWRFDDRRRRLR